MVVGKEEVESATFFHKLRSNYAKYTNKAKKLKLVIKVSLSSKLDADKLKDVKNLVYSGTMQLQPLLFGRYLANGKLIVINGS